MEYHTASDPASSFDTQVVARGLLSVTLDGLTPSTEYDVRVRGENAVGRSDPSATLRTKTDGELTELLEFTIKIHAECAYQNRSYCTGNLLLLLQMKWRRGWSLLETLKRTN